MNIKVDYLTPNIYSRPQKERQELRAVVLHWTGNVGANAKNNRDYFNNLPEINKGLIKAGKSEIYASAHYVIGQDGEIICCIPENEIAYHCGTGKKDPKSGRIYTDYAREKFGEHFTSPKVSSPNFCTIGIELCPVDGAGNFTAATIAAAVELCADICRRYGLTARDLTTHNAVVGWKDCPRLWVNRPGLFDAFTASVNDYICRGKA